MSTIVALWVLPGLIAALTGLRIRDLFGRLHNSLIVAFVAGDLFIVLPGLIEGCKDLLARQSRAVLSEQASSELVAGPDVIVPVSFNFPHAGKLLSLSFVPFAAWFSDEALRLRDYPQLFGAGLLSFFGSLNSAVPFPARPVRPAGGHLPAVHRHGSDQLTVRHARRRDAHGDRGDCRERRRHGWPALALSGGLMRFGVATALIVAVTLIGLRVLFATALRQEFAGADLVYGMQPLLGGAPAAVAPAPPPEAGASDRGVSII